MILLAMASIVALVFPSAFEEYRKRIGAESGAESLDPPPATIQAALPPEIRPGRTSLTAGPDGHFRTSARFNGRSIDVLVDTGATYVALNEATARRLGLNPGPGEFRYRTKTANGEVPVAVTTIDRLQIGSVEVRNVEAAITKGAGLDTVLLGMSFLQKLSRYEVTNGRLDLIR